MEQQINREDLLRQLESVIPGLSARDFIEQSSCFIFKDGKVMTFNDEVACTNDCSLNVEGAVSSQSLITLLRKLTEKTLKIEVIESELVIRGSKKSAGIRMDAEIALPVDSIGIPKKGWKRLPENFIDAINVVKDCAGTDQSAQVLTCIHIHPNRIEASDNYQLTRYFCEMKLKAPVLVKRDAIRHITAMDMASFAEAPNWIHFKNGSGMVLSCRRREGTFPDVEPYFDFKGQKVSLPSNLSRAIDKAQVFSSEEKDSNHVKVTIRKDKFRIRGEGATGWFTEWFKDTAYKGPTISFLISPDLLINLTQHDKKVCEIGEGRLKVDAGEFVYVTALEKGEEK